MECLRLFVSASHHCLVHTAESTHPPPTTAQYDNEYGYANRLVDLAAIVAEKL